LLLVSSDDVPLNAEYALFDPGEIELRASGPGTVREAGYQTTAAKARDRLASQGIDANLVTAVEEALRKGPAAAYARGEAVRHLVSEMSAGEMLEGGVWMGEEQSYRGTWLRMDELARDLDIVQAPLALQAVALASTLNDLADDAPVVLSTLEYTRDRRPGERTHRRVALEHATELATAIAGLEMPAPYSDEHGPNKAELLEAMRRHAEIFASAGAKERLIRFERTLAERQMPTRGPLSDSSLWKIELLLAQGTTEGVQETLDTLEKMRGRSPSTTYLRARASFLTGQADPRIIAERVGALALSMHNAFPELELLAAEAWFAAGDVKRALPYARDLLANPGVHADLRGRAERILRRSENPGGKPERISARPQTSPPGAALRARQGAHTLDNVGAAVGMGAVGDERTMPAGGRVVAVGDERTLPAGGRVVFESDIPSALGGSGSSGPNSGASASGSPMRRSSLPASPPIVPAPPVPIFAAPRGADDDGLPDLDALPRAEGKSLPPTPRETKAPPLPRTSRASIPVTNPSRSNLRAPLAPLLNLDTPDPPPAAPGGSAYPARSGSIRPSQPPPSNRERRPSADPRAEPDSSAKLTALDEILAEDIVEIRPGDPMPDRSGSQRPRSPSSRPGSNAPTGASSSIAPGAGGSAPPDRRSMNDPVRFEFMRGSSQPSFRANPPAVPSNASPYAAAPSFPKIETDRVEMAAELLLPYGLNNERWSGHGPPRSILEARIHFTHLSRQLGIRYRQELGLELTADVAGIEMMQRQLATRYDSHLVRSVEEAEDVRRHGALLSEIILRQLHAEWIDLSSTELGYWAMLVPPDTRIWPFGRVLRFISLGHQERDLVSYFLELQTRMRGE
jgi:hypothetical protein